MTQIVDERLKKMCDKCHGYLDKPCAWLSLGNEYCDEIMTIQQELQRKDNIINELKKEISNFDNFKIYYGNKNANSFLTLGANYYREYILDKIKEIEEK